MKKEKYLQIFNYLLEFSKLRSNPIRNIESSDTQYPEKVWFADLQQLDSIDCITFPNYNQDSDYWIKVNKPKSEPIAPQFIKLSNTLSDWIESESLTDENGIPKLKTILDKDGKTLLLSEMPIVESEFQTYLNEKWLDDLEFYKKQNEKFKKDYAEYEKKRDIYKLLFSIYNKAQQFGEEYELIIGVGLLYFQKSTETPLICRHLFTTRVEISFNEKTFAIIVSPTIESELKIETDSFIDLGNIFDSNNIIEAEKLAQKIIDENEETNPFNEITKQALLGFATRFEFDGDYINELSRPKTPTQTPTIYFAPALLLRKRNTKSLTAVYEKIIEDISNASDSLDIPLINGIIMDSENTNSLSPDSGSQIPCLSSDDIIYFPKKYNDEQIEIIEKLRKDNKVLVQGPPGTGKSHTIANLICHLLAKGKKVLVTAYTKRALEVLKKQLPEEFQNLTVNLLSSDSISIQGLESSVNAINNELSIHSNLSSLRKEIEKKEVELNSLKEENAKIKNEWLKIKEKSTRVQNVNQNYKGTLIEIAEQIEKERQNFLWFKDEFTDINKINEVITNIEKFGSQARYYDTIDCGIFNSIIPSKEKLPTTTELIEYRKMKNELDQISSSRENYEIIRCNNYPELKRWLSELKELFERIGSIDHPFKEEIILDYKSKLNDWNYKLSKAEKILAKLPGEKLEQIDKSIEVKYPNDKSLIQLKSDAEELLKLLNEGKKLSGFLSVFNNPFAKTNIKRKKYFVNAVYVNGHPCDSAPNLQVVLEDIRIKQNFEELGKIWEITPNGNLKSYADSTRFYKQMIAETQNLFSLLSESEELKYQIESLSSIRLIDNDGKRINKLISDCSYSQLLSSADKFKREISVANNHLSINNIHPIAKEIQRAMGEINAEQYERLLLEIDKLNSEKEQYLKFGKLITSLSKDFPILIKEILENSFDISNFKHLADAIYFKHTLREIERILEGDYETNLEARLLTFDERERKLISVIASKKAWLSVIESLTNNPSLRQHLEAWVQAEKKIGKTGIGKRALKFRREAQRQMEKCKDSVPCWIMPLYKVAETIRPQQGMYDYVIIDEASQLGADAIFLMYISKNIIIVGDDKQTSPEYVGVEANSMTPHINRYLQNIPFANYYGTEFSFFDHAKRFCNGMAVLREHFRCMPEIIEFSNRYFYAPDGKGLYPLKQYSENRLEPLKHEYCQNGYVDGASQNITNKVEAEAIANKIAEIVKDEKYKNKSFGVIALQGNRQAAIIENSIIKKIGEGEFKKRKIICGTSASFQGDERDVVFLSLITAHNHNRASLTKPEDERRFNVAMSRAKEQIWLFHSIQLEDLSNTNDLRYKLLDYFLNYKQKQVPVQNTIERKIGTQPEPFESWFEVDVYNDIIIHDYSVIPQYIVAKGRYRIDLVVLLSNGIKIAIECDGDKYHGPEQFQDDLMRQKVLERCGWQFIRIRGAEYYSNRVKALEPLWKKLQENDILENESPSLNNHPQSWQRDNEEDHLNGMTQPTIRTPIIIEKKGTQQPELFSGTDAPQATVVPLDNDKQQDNKIKISAGLFSFPQIMVFTSNYNMYKVQNSKLETLSQINSEFELETDEKPIYYAGILNYSGYLIVGFQNGKVGKISIQSFKIDHVRAKLKNAYNGESKLIFIEYIENDIDLVALSSIKKVVLFNTSKINPVESRTTKGVQVMKSKDGSYMVKLKKLSQVKLQYPEYYRKDESLNAIGYYLRPEDEI